MKVISEGYQNLLQMRYKQKGWGSSGYSHADKVHAFAKEIGAATILDYGCGRGTLKKALTTNWVAKDGTPAASLGWSPEAVSEYDPGIVGKDTLPGPADLLVSTDVLEHIEPKLLMNVLGTLKGLGKKGQFHNISTKLAKEILPDGRNAHLIVEPGEWWLRRFREAGIPVTRHDVWRKGVYIWSVL